MRRIQLITLLCLALFFADRTEAQVTFDLRIDQSILTAIPDTASLGFVDTIMISIWNDSATSFSGQINLFYTINNNGIHNADSVGNFYYPSSFNNETISPHDSIVRSLIINVTDPAFIIGSSGVVIWPIAPGSSNHTYISDTVTKTIYVTYPTEINGPTDKNLKIYQDGQFLVIQENDQYLLKSVRLYSVAGALLHEQSISRSGQISMTPYAAGAYFVEVIYADDSRRVVKVLNTR